MTDDVKDFVESAKNIILVKDSEGIIVENDEDGLFLHDGDPVIHFGVYHQPVDEDDVNEFRKEIELDDEFGVGTNAYSLDYVVVSSERELKRIKEFLLS